jgi:hypothetical protein
LPAERPERPLTDDEVTRYLLQRRLLRDACRALQHDDGGRYCRQCCVREFCESQAGRAVC